MTQDFAQAIHNLEESDAFKDFKKEHTSYHLVHGFLQLDKDGTPANPWQIGFYSNKKDNLGVFSTEPAKFLNFEDAFKEGGVISELVFDKEVFVSTTDAINQVKTLVAKDYPSEQTLSYILVLQVIDKKPVYNITAITVAFSMITVRIHATTGEMLTCTKRSVLDLKKDD